MSTRERSSDGFTIVELITAVVAASIFITVVFTGWNYISKTTALRQRRTTLQSECERVTQLVTGAIQKAEGVIRYDRNSIWLLGAENADTTVFSHDGTTITKNDTPLHFVLSDIQVVEFQFENMNSDYDGKPYLLEFRCTLVSAMNDTASVRTTVMGRRPRGDELQSEGDFMW